MSQVTASFQLFSIDGLCVKFSLAGETEAPAAWVDNQIAQFYKAGYRTEPVEGNLKPQTIPIVGYVRTTTQDSQNPGQFKPALALFSPWGDFTAITVYAEKLPELPFTPTGKVWDGGAFDRNLITSKGYFNKCDMKIVKEPIIDFEGKPKLTDAGNQKWRFVKVIEMDGKPIDTPDQPVVTQPTQQQAPTKPVVTQPPTNGKATDPKREAVKRMLLKARDIYGENGATQAMLKIASEIAGKEITGMGQLTDAQLAHVDLLLTLQQTGIQEYGDVIAWSEALPVLLGEYRTDNLYSLTPHQLSNLAQSIKASGIPSDDEDIAF